LPRSGCLSSLSRLSSRTNSRITLLLWQDKFSLGEISIGRTLRISKAIDWLNEKIGRSILWLVLVAALISAFNAIYRKVFSDSSNLLLEIQWYLFGAIFLLCAAYTLKHEGHVRIDVMVGLVIGFPGMVTNFVSKGPASSGPTTVEEFKVDGEASEPAAGDGSVEFNIEGDSKPAEEKPPQETSP
jgi:hypothetical protein